MFLASGVIACSCQNNRYLFYCNQPTIVTVNVVCALLCGLAASVVWPSASAYISEQAGTIENKQLYFSVFTSFYMASQIFGNMLTIFIL